VAPTLSCSVSSVLATVKRLSTPKCASIKLSLEALWV
jgi:hypothetical protein